MSNVATIEPKVWRETSEPGYFVSNLGEVKSPNGRILANRKHSNGYTRVYLGAKTERYVHHLVAEAFIGPRPDGFEVDHIDMVRDNNNKENLRYITVAENRARRLVSRGDKHPHAKMTALKVLELRRLHKSGVATAALAMKFDISKRQARAIWSGENWAHV